MGGHALLVGLIFLAFALFAGCGGDPPPPATTTQAITKSEFLAQADAICRSFESRIEAQGDDLFADGKKPSAAEARPFALRIAIPNLEREISAIRSLGVPPGDRAPIEAILAAAERGLEQIRDRPLTIVDRAPPALERAGRLARRYGSQECGAG